MDTAQIDSQETKDRLKLAALFRRFGRIGFWVQLAVGAVLALIGALFFVTSQTQNAAGHSGFVGYIAMASLPILAFTTCWFWRYRRIGALLRDDPARVNLAALPGKVWVGIAASSIGVILSTIVITAEMGTLLIAVLNAPQAGVAVIQTPQGVTWISAFDIFGLMTLTLEIAVEVMVLIFGLWLLFNTSRMSPAPVDGRTDA